jgi:hypothetical protein
MTASCYTSKKEWVGRTCTALKAQHRPLTQPAGPGWAWLISYIQLITEATSHTPARPPTSPVTPPGHDVISDAVLHYPGSGLLDASEVPLTSSRTQTAPRPLCELKPALFFYTCTQLPALHYQPYVCTPSGVRFAPEARIPLALQLVIPRNVNSAVQPPRFP